MASADWVVEMSTSVEPSSMAMIDTAILLAA
jgi:hypothetical protein